MILNSLKLAVLLISMSLCVPALTADLTGLWKTIDDKTQKPKSIIRITKEEERLFGTVEKLIDPSEKDPICKFCPDDYKGKPIVGLRILRGLKPNETNSKADGGRILDPKSGKDYSCKIELKKEGQELEVRGFLGISLLGRSQTWIRISEAEATSLPESGAQP